MRSLAIYLLVLLLPALAQARTWTDSTGTVQVEGEFVGMTSDDKVLLRLSDGKIQSAPLLRFSAADQQYLKDQIARKAAARMAAIAARLEELAGQIAANPQDSRSHRLRGAALIEAGRIEDALQDFNRAIQLNPQSADAYDGRGMAQAARGKLREAHDDFSQAIELDPKLGSAYLHRAANMKVAMRTEEGRQALASAIAAYQRPAKPRFASPRRALIPEPRPPVREMIEEDEARAADLGQMPFEDLPNTAR